MYFALVNCNKQNEVKELAMVGLIIYLQRNHQQKLINHLSKLVIAENNIVGWKRSKYKLLKQKINV